MIKSLRKIFHLLEKKEISRFWLLQFLIVGSSLFQIASITAFGPFIAIINDTSILYSDGILSDLFKYINKSENEFIVFTGLLLLLAVIFSSLISIYCSWRMSDFSWKITMALSIRLYKNYINEEWIYHTKNSSARLIEQIFIECRRLGDSVIAPIISISGSAIYVILVIVLAFIYNPIISIVGFSIIGSFYVLIFIIAKKFLKQNGENITTQSLARSALLTDSFSAIRDIILCRKQAFFYERFKRSSDSFGRSQAINTIIGAGPRYLVELLALSSIIIITVIIFRQGEDSFNNTVPVLSVFGLISIKLIPHFQIIFSSLSKIKGNVVALNLIYDDLKTLPRSEDEDNIESKLIFKDKIKLENLCYKYNDSSDYVIKNLTLEISKNSNIGVIGFSGSGKSTLIDLIAGLLNPVSGTIQVDSVNIHSDINAWRKKISLVSQNINLINDSFKNNIAFGEDENEIDYEKLDEAIEKAHLKDVVAKLDDGIESIVGERGVTLSGGQRQRLGIARAIYKSSEVLIFDEATSALDGSTEKEVLNAIKSLKGYKTIISVAHRLSTLSNCDTICVLDNGKVIEKGTYQYLELNNAIFKKMLHVDS